MKENNYIQKGKINLDLLRDDINHQGVLTN